MSNDAGGTIPQPVSQLDLVRALLREGKNDQAIVRLSAIRVIQPDDLIAKELLFDAFS